MEKVQVRGCFSLVVLLEKEEKVSWTLRVFLEKWWRGGGIPEPALELLHPNRQGFLCLRAQSGTGAGDN